MTLVVENFQTAWIILSEMMLIEKVFAEMTLVVENFQNAWIILLEVLLILLSLNACVAFT